MTSRRRAAESILFHLLVTPAGNRDGERQLDLVCQALQLRFPDT